MLKSGGKEGVVGALIGSIHDVYRERKIVNEGNICGGQHTSAFRHKSIFVEQAVYPPFLLLAP